MLKSMISECYQSLTAHQHQKNHTVPKQVIIIATSIQVASLRTALCESIRYQAKSEQNVRQDLILRERHVEAALMNPYVRINCSRLKHFIYSRDKLRPNTIRISAICHI